MAAKNIVQEPHMTTQILTTPAARCNIFGSLALAYPNCNEPTQACTLDYGFDFDEEQLGREQLAPLPSSLVHQPNQHVEPEEFETLYRWFNFL